MMWPRKPKRHEKARPFPGKRCALDGHAAAFTVARMAADAVVTQSVPDLAGSAGPSPEKAVLVREVGRPDALAALVAGYAQSGLRANALIGGDCGRILPALAGRRLTCVISLTGVATERQAASLHGAHDEYYAASASGVFQMFARNAQEVADFTLIAHRAAEHSLCPGVCGQDLYRTTHSVQDVRLPEPELILEYLGRPDDVIDSPFPAQRMLFGKHRRRVPVLVDRDHPAGVGGVQDRDGYFKAIAAQRPFFSSHVDESLRDSMQAFGDLTGRRYAPVSGYRADDADVLVVAQGGVVEELEAVVDYLRSKEKVKAGVLSLTVYRPFPGAELTRLIKGRKAITVLERTDQPLSEDLPLSKEIRSAIDKAVENGLHDRAGDLPHPSYEAYRAVDRPRVLSGIYGVGGELPSFEELVAVYRNMSTRGAPKGTFYVGGIFDQPVPRFPHLQTLQQQLRKDYAGLDGLSLSGAADVAVPDVPGEAVELHSLSMQGGLFAGNFFARALSDSLDWSVRTYPCGGLERNLQPATLTMVFGGEERARCRKPGGVDFALVTGERLLESMPSDSQVKKGGTLIVESSRGDELWPSLSTRTVGWIRERELRLFLVDARKIATETASKPSFTDQLVIWALLGAYLDLTTRAAEDEAGRFVEDLHSTLQAVFGAGHYHVDDITTCIRKGAESAAEFDWRSKGAGEDGVSAEAEPPWTVEHAGQHDRTLFDVTRFWHSVGYLYDTGRASEAVTDPYLATGVIPAGSSAFRDMIPYRLRIPGWLPENCTGCGLCWAHCPDSALPPSVQPMRAIIETAVEVCREEGAAMVQMQRIGDHLAKQAYKLILKDDLHQYLTAGPLLQEAFSSLTEKIGLEGEKLEELQAEFGQVHGMLENHPLARTDFFLSGPHEKEKGSGAVLSIALNPLSCTGCGICVDVCPEGALEWTDQSPERLQKLETSWQFQMKLPRTPPEKVREYASSGAPDTEVHRLLDKTAYHSLVGGDVAFPGNSAKAAVHLVTAAVESVMQPRFEAHVAKLDRLIGQIEDKIQGKVSGAVHINDFDTFGRELDRLGAGDISAEKLAKLVGGERRAVAPTQLKRLTDLLARLKEQRRCYVEGAGGAGRARMAVTIARGSAAFWSGTYPFNPHRHPWVSHLPGDAPALARGVFEGITRQVASELRDCRQAELELDDKFDPDERGLPLDTLDWLDGEDWNVVPPVLVIGERGAISWDDTSQLLSGGYPIKIVIIDTVGLEVAAENALGREEGTGVLALSHEDAFVLQTSLGHPGHLIGGVARGIDSNRPALFHIYAPDPHLCGIATEKTAEQARLAFESRMFPLFSREPERIRTELSLAGNPDAAEAWTTKEVAVKEPSGTESTISVPLTVADWAAREARFQREFKIVPKGELNEHMRPLSVYLALEKEKRAGLEPFVNVTDEKQRHFLAVVSDRMAAATEERLRHWRSLQRMAAGTTEALPRPSAEAQAAEPPPVAGVPEPTPAAAEASAHEKLTERLLWLCGYSQDPEFFKQSLRDFITRRSGTAAAEEACDD